MKFNNSQLLAVSHGSGPMLVLAGPGSGKTTVIISRIQRMVSTLNIPPENILAVTFSRSAANEMAERYSSALPAPGPIPTFGTFHSIFLNILNSGNTKANLSLISEKEKYVFLRTEILRHNLVYENINEYMNSLIASISRYKETGSHENVSFSFYMPAPSLLSNLIDSSLSAIKPDSCAKKSAQISQYMKNQDFFMLFNSYQKMLKDKQLIDFDDIIIMCADYLEKDPIALKKWQNRYPYILVDEFQDISPAQYKVIKLLGGSSQNLFVVGDDDQSIYSFRGASPASMRLFMSDHPDAKKVLLNVNYRCVPAIISSALEVIGLNTDRFEKQIIPYRENISEALSISSFENRYEEYINIINSIQKYHFDKIDNIAVLFRNNSDSSLFIRLLSDYNIPFTAPAISGSVLDHFTIRDILSYMRLSFELTAGSTNDSLKLFSDILNKPSRYISRDALVGLSDPSATNCFKRLYQVYHTSPSQIEKIRELEMNLNFISRMSPYGAVKYIRNAVGYNKWLSEFAKTKNKDYEEYAAYLDAFEDYSIGFKSFNALQMRIKDEKQHDFSSLTIQGNENEKLQPVKIMTMHASKGMEFDVVFLPDSNDSIIPNKKALKEGLENEERRLYYVAMTRAKNALHISFVKQLHNKNAYPTRFLKPIYTK